MKKLFRASLFLLSVGAFTFASQISCKKSLAQQSGSQPASNLLLLGKPIAVAGAPQNIDSGRTVQTTVSTWDLYVENLDGSNLRQIPISLPSGLYIGQPLEGSTTPCYLLPNGQTLVFSVFSQTLSVHSLYSCGIDGSNLRKVGDIDKDIQLLGAY